MRCTDAAIESPLPDDYEPWMGEPPAAWERRTPDDILATIERDLQSVQVLRLLEPEWLENLPIADRLSNIITAFGARGGRVER
jgi:hypothetical protein